MLRPEGVIITALHRASPLAEAGLAVGDVVIEVAGQPVNTPEEMLFRMSVQGLGETVEMVYLHEAARVQADVTLIAPPEDPPRETHVLGNREVLGRSGSRAHQSGGDSRTGVALEQGRDRRDDTGTIGAAGRTAARRYHPPCGSHCLGDTRRPGAGLLQAAPNVLLDVERGGRRVILRFRA